METHHLATPDGTLAYDVRGPLPTSEGRPPLMMIGQPMSAAGFATLAGYFEDRTVVTYDPRGLERSHRTDGSLVNDPVLAAQDLHAVIEAVGVGPVDLLASSGGAVNALALVAAHPDDVRVLVAHEPPLLALLPDAEQALAAERAVGAAYAAKGWGAGMAQFILLGSWQGELNEEYAAEPPGDPAQFGLPTEDDGARDDPLLSGVSGAVTAYRPDVARLEDAPTRIVIAAGVETGEAITQRAAAALADLMGLPLTMFPSHHGGFAGPEFGQAGQPAAFASRLREVLAG